MERCKCMACSRGYHGILRDSPCELFATGLEGFCKGCYESAKAKRDVAEIAGGSGAVLPTILESAASTSREANAARLRGLLQRHHPAAVSLAEVLLAAPAAASALNLLPRDELETLLRLGGSGPIVRRILQHVPPAQLDELAAPAGSPANQAGGSTFDGRVLVMEHRYLRADADETHVLSALTELWQPAAQSRVAPGALADRITRATPDTFRDLEGALRSEWRASIAEDREPDEEVLAALTAALGSVPVRQLAIVTRLLARAPRPQQAAALKDVWFLLEDFSTRVDRSTIRYQALGPWDTVSTIVDLACLSVAESLARAAVVAGDLVDLAQDEASCRQIEALDEQIRPVREEYIRISDLYNAGVKAGSSSLAGGSWTGLGHLERQLPLLRERAEALEQQLVALLAAREAKWREIRRTLSPAWVLLSVARRAAHYADAAVQAAVAGLFEYLRDGRMTEASQAQIRQSLAAVLGGDTAQRLRERVIRLLPDSDQADLLQALKEGVAWMLALEEVCRANPGAAALGDAAAVSDVVPPPTSSSPDTAGDAEALAPVPDPASDPNGGSAGGTADDFSGLGDTVEVMLARIPGLLAFLERYPIRLLSAADLKGAFGIYRQGGAQIELWYRFDRQQEDGGHVSERYLRLNDRTKPNAIGLDYRLLQHPLLCCPVLFHEMVHYGGLSGEESDGVRNELFVLFCEIAFAKALLADLAPGHADAVPDYEQRLVEMCTRTGYQGLIYQYLDDIESPSQMELYNLIMPAIYPPARSPHQSLFEQNMRIKLANMSLTWCAWIPWPELGGVETAHVTAAFLLARAERDAESHTLTAGQRDRLARTPVIRRYLARWRLYAARPGALAVLTEARGRFESKQALAATDLGRLTAVRSLDLW